jgi:hypothetical protein
MRQRIVCRTVIEACIRDICARRDLFPTLEENVVLFEEFTWKELREKVSSGVLEENLKQIQSLCMPEKPFQRALIYLQNVRRCESHRDADHHLVSS